MQSPASSFPDVVSSLPKHRDFLLLGGEGNGEVSALGYRGVLGLLVRTHFTEFRVRRRR